MTNKKAFTLIELLAVIIILAAIALIIAPLVLDIIKEQKMKTFKESINGVLRSSRLELVNSGLSFPATFTYSDGKLVSPSGKELKVTGKIPGGSGTVTYYQEDNIELFIHDNDWCGSYNRTNKEVEVNEYTGTCGVVFTPETCFEFDENTGTITDYLRNDTDCPADVVIPDTIGGVPVEVIGEYSFKDKSLTSVTIGNSVTSIGSCAFNDNQLPDDQAFIYARNSNGTINNTKIVSYGGAKRDNVVIPSNVTSIGDDAFYDNELTSVVIPNSVTSIGDDAFSYNQLTSVTIPNSVTSIGYGAFRENQLTSVVIPNSVTIIGNSAFRENQLTSVEIPNSVTSIGYDAFRENQLTSVTIQGKSSSSDFTYYPSSTPFGWASGYSDSNIIWNG